MTNTERVVRSCAAKLPSDSRTIIERVLDAKDEPSVSLVKLAAALKQSERELRIRWWLAIHDLRSRFGSKPEIRAWCASVTAANVEEYARFELQASVGRALCELTESHREVLDVWLDQVRRGEKPNVSHAAEELGISFSACHERLGRAMGSLRNLLLSDAEDE